jgi:hypothetical protein
MQRIEREPCFYHDETGERFLAVVAAAQAAKDKKLKGAKQFIFWMAVIFVFTAIVCAGAYYGGGQ